MEELQFTPFPELKTERLLLRQLIPTDDSRIFQLRSDKEVSKFVNRPLCKSLDEAQAFINKINTSIANNESLYWVLSTKPTNELIGTICLWNIQKEHSRAEVGFELLPGFQRKGFMQEALEAVLGYGFNTMKLHSFEGVVSPGNSASIKVLEKNNFIREGYFKENIFYNGSFQDTAIYSLLSPYKI